MGKPTLNSLVETYVKCRDKKAELEAEHKEKIKPLNEAMGKLENYFLKVMQDQGLESLPTEAGTPYSAIRTSVKIADGDVFFRFVSENDLWQLLDRRAAKTAVGEYIEDTGEIPPGLDVTRDTIVNVRRK